MPCMTIELYIGHNYYDPSLLSILYMIVCLPACMTIQCSWIVNILDGLLLIVAHATDAGPGHTRSVLYQYIYNPTYIYIVWLLEVTLIFQLTPKASYRPCTVCTSSACGSNERILHVYGWEFSSGF